MAQSGEPIVTAGQRSAVEYDAEGKCFLVGTRCGSCGKVSFLERAVCPSCLSYEGQEKTLIGRTGKINNFTVAHVAPSGYKPPYILGFVDLAEGPRIFATIEGDLDAASRLCVGDEVRLAVEEATGPAGDKKIRWKYVPIGK